MSVPKLKPNYDACPEVKCYHSRDNKFDIVLLVICSNSKSLYNLKLHEQCYNSTEINNTSWTI